MNPQPTPPAAPPERRQAPRLPYATRVEYDRRQERGTGRVRDLSGEGMFFEAPGAFAVGERLQIRFRYRHGGAQIGMVGEVAHIRPDGVGVRFLW